MEIENIPKTELIKAVENIFDAAYKGDDLTKRVAEILGMKSVKGWSIIDTYENLALVHYNERSDDDDDEVDMKVCGHLRGVLVDTEKGDIIANSFGYTPTAVVSEIVDEDGKLVFVDNDGNKHTFTTEDNITRIFEGVVIRVIWFNSKLYRITHKKIFPIKSHWGNSKNFITLYEEAGGPVAEQLFDTTKPFSNTCYHFMVVDPALLVATRQRVSAPYIVCLEQQPIKLSHNPADIAPGKASFEFNEKINATINKSFIHMPKKLTITEANKHLSSGYYKAFQAADERLTTGEGVIIYRKENGVITNVLKVNSKSYDWRCNMRGGNPNVVNQFYALLGTTYPELDSDQAWANFQKRVVLFPLYSVNEMKKQFDATKIIVSLSTLPADRKNFANKKNRAHLLWINFVLALPANLQEDALEILDNFEQDRKNLCNWVSTIEKNVKDIDSSQHCAHVKRIINAARKLARQDIADGKNLSAKGGFISLPVMIVKKINNLIFKEKGISLYQMIKEMKQVPKKKENKEVEKEEIAV